MEGFPNNESAGPIDPTLAEFIDNYPGLDPETREKLKRETSFPGIRKAVEAIKRGL